MIPQKHFTNLKLTVIVRIAYVALECLLVVVIIHCKIVRLMVPLAIHSNIHDYRRIHLQQNSFFAQICFSYFDEFIELLCMLRFMLDTISPYLSRNFYFLY